MAAVRRIAPAIFGNRFRCRHRESMWRCVAGGIGSVAGGFAAVAMVVRCHRFTAAATPEVLDQYREAQPLTLGQPLMR